MAILTRIRNVLPSATTVLTKGAGLAALGMVAYDSNYLGKVQSDLYASSKDAKSSVYYLNNSMHLGNMSKFQSKIKDMSYSTELDQTWKRFFNEGIGYVKGFTSMLVNHAVPLGLGLGALLGGKKTSIASACGIGVYGIYSFIKNFFGIGVPNNLKIDQ
ncbi:MAG: hypothetical protein SPL76_04745 [Cyanobacteriota bacterium]|nr:hypothetical protein [Cyanobacteriota bacterium]